MTKRSTYDREMKSASYRRTFEVEFSEVTKSSKNVFAELVLSNPEEGRLKAKPTLQIHNLIENRG